MTGFNRFESLKKAILDGNAEFAMMLADFHLVKGTITQEQYNELEALAYPVVEQNDEEII